MGGIPLQFRKRLNFRIASSTILTPYIGPTLLNRETKYHFKNDLRLVEAMDNLANFLENQFDYISFKTYYWWNDIRPFQWRGWKCGVSYTYMIDLPEIDVNQFDPEVKRKVNRAEKQDIRFLIFDTLTKNELQRFLMLQNKTFNRQGRTLPLTDDQFTDMILTIQQNGISLKLYATIMDDIWLAASIRILYKDQVYGCVSGADPEYFKTGANQLLMWKCLEDWDQKGYKTFDFVGANIRSIAAYKATFGGRLTPYYSVSWMSPSFKKCHYAKSIIKSGLHKFHFRRKSSNQTQ